MGSTGSVWASDQMKVTHEYPNLYEIPNENVQRDIKMKIYAYSVTDHVTYFNDKYEVGDLVSVEKK